MVNEATKDNINPKNMTRKGNFEDLNVGDVFGHYPGDLQIITALDREDPFDKPFTKTNIKYVDLNGREGIASFFNDNRSNFKASVYLPNNNNN